MMMKRRHFLALPAALTLPAWGREPASTRVGLVRSDHGKLRKQAPPDDDLDYEIVRAMVWQAIDYGRPAAGSLGEKIEPGSWVVIKPNGVYLRPARSYRPGDITDLRVVRAVVEYVAAHSSAGRITIAEGSSIRGPHDKAKNRTVSQNGRQVGMLDFDWGPNEFPGFNGSLAGMLKQCAARHPEKRFDFIDLNYDAVRDPGGNLKRLEVPVAPNGVGAFSMHSDYHVTNTILNCDFLISVPVIKIHLACGLTACFKNYVGTAPREAYAYPNAWSNIKLHERHEIDNRVSPFIVDLASFHPPDYCVADGIQGLQYKEHNDGSGDQTVRNNFVVAGEDPVATDATIASLIGLNPWDVDFLHMAALRGMGTMDAKQIDVIGDDPVRLQRYWGKPRRWIGRCNREWLVSNDPAAPVAAWKRRTSRSDTLRSKQAPGKPFAAAVYVDADASAKAFLWVGAKNRVRARLNGAVVMDEENVTRYRTGQFQAPVELRSGENLLEFEVRSNSEETCLSAILVGPRNDGDSVEGIRWRNHMA